MSIVAEFTIGADGFALAETFRAVPDARIEAERVATHSREWVMPFCWMAGGDEAAFTDALENDPTVDRCQIVETTDETTLYNIRWADEVGSLIDEIIDQHGIVLEASGGDGAWFFRLRFLTRAQLSDFQAHFNEQGPEFEVHRIIEPSEPRQLEYGLTPDQLEVLRLTLEQGYFRVPRETSLATISDSLGISQNATSQRVRRGLEALLENTLEIKGDGERIGRNP
ncbi:helix-turn-helix domain-containing protein [Halobacteria archaeon AArc-m2/3/4]|uniref:Helix-turn-helix domain-containing protein n=1 Tax=Natronoglomus mannanivorans TaxID=2979990 RepID=A0AAP2Z351_9EURY|nr:helix-turn-helix domain-containing protein [Halobacteria archaeon AArc-xg1-1]MCU4975536.1 helix-turn-helix domain-containing protein [Halobacteria archaeon AArc-m2/3/4]